MNERIKQLLTLVLTWVGIAGPSLFSALTGGMDTGEISDQFFGDVLIIPADYAFAIWAPIYLGFLIFAVYQALPAQRDNPRFRQVRPWLMLTAGLNAAWLIVFNSLLNFPLSAVIIVGMLITALAMQGALEIGRTRVTGWERWLRVPFSLYAGWLTAATILNVAGVLTTSGWDGGPLSFPAWGVIMLAVATAVGLAVRFLRRDPVYGGVFVWAFVGVIVANLGVPLVAVAAAVLAVVVLLTLIRPLGRLFGSRGSMQPVGA